MVNITRVGREGPRGKVLPASAFVLLFIYAVVQLQSDIPSRWTAFLRLGGGNALVAQELFPGNEVVGNVGTDAPVPLQAGGRSDKTEQVKREHVRKGQDPVDAGSSSAKTPPEIIDIDQQQGGSTPKKATSEIVVAHQTFKQKCTEKQSGDARKEITEHLAKILTPPSTVRKLAKKDPVEPCQNAFIDLGANIGDSMGKLIDAGFDNECPNYGRNSHARFNLTTGVMEIGRGNELITFTRNAMNDVGRSPEDYCYVGVEGNPVFTERLQHLESRIMETSPRPLRAAHFYTESVGAGEDGPTFLYLDTVNTANNFWGSSILSTHQDAKKSAAENGNVTVKAPVTGLTLSTLLKRSVQKVNGSHVIIKIDIEGGEYVVINEAIDTLCDFASAGVRVDLMMETHSPRVTGQYSPEMKLYQAETKKRIPECGIRTGNLAGASH